MKNMLFCKRRTLIKMVITILILCISLSACSDKSLSNITYFDNAESAFLLTPPAKGAGELYQICILDSEPGESSSQFLYGFLEELKMKGWISYTTLPFSDRGITIEDMINRLSQMELGEFISFNSDNYYEMKGENEGEISKSLEAKAQNGEIDIVLAMGTSPGLLMKELNLDLLTLVTMATDPIASGIIKSKEDSGNPNMWALVEPNSMGRQLKYYDEMFDIEKLGMLTIKEYEDVAAIPEYEDMAKQRNMEINKIVLSDGQRDENFYQQLELVMEQMAASDIDAFLLTYGVIDDVKRCRQLIQPLLDKNIPVLVSDGEALVEEGGLLCVSSYDYVGYGSLCAKVTVSVFNGKEVGSLPCEYVSAPFIVFNMETAKEIEFMTSFQFLLSCDKIFTRRNR